MKKFVYTDNKKSPPVVLAEIEAESILDADKEFEKLTKIQPIKVTSIGCQIMEIKGNK